MEAADELNEWDERLIAKGRDLDPEQFPALRTISAAFMYRALPHRSTPPVPPEYVYVPVKDHALKAWFGLAQWNMKWEAGPERNKLWWHRLPPALRYVSKQPDTDFRFVPWTSDTRYPALAPLYHLLPARLLQQHGLPPLARGVWPCLDAWMSRLLPADHEERLSRAVACHLWPLLVSRSRPSTFARRDPIKLLAHALDFWLPYIDVVIQKRARALGPVKVENEEQQRVIEQLQAASPPNVEVSRPFYGGYVWSGEDEARDVAEELVEVADEHGRLRAIIDAVCSHRVEEDFSPRWSFLREDFERKLYQKRSRVKVTFVELDKTAPVIGPTSDIDGNLMWQDLLGLVHPSDRRVVVLLRNGFTRATEIARRLGYANHSPVSKALARIRERARDYLWK